MFIKNDLQVEHVFPPNNNSVNAQASNHSLMDRLTRSASVRDSGSGNRKAVSVGTNVFDRLAKGGPAATGARRGSGALETLNSPRAVSAARSPLIDEASKPDVVKRGTLTKIKDLVKIH